MKFWYIPLIIILNEPLQKVHNCLPITFNPIKSKDNKIAPIQSSQDLKMMIGPNTYLTEGCSEYIIVYNKIYAAWKTHLLEYEGGKPEANNSDQLKDKKVATLVTKKITGRRQGKTAPSSTQKSKKRQTKGQSTQKLRRTKESHKSLKPEWNQDMEEETEPEVKEVQGFFTKYANKDKDDN